MTQDTTQPGPTLRVLGIAGSLRAGSYNRALLRAAQELAPAGMTIATFDLDAIPPYNSGRLTAEPTRLFLGKFLQAFAQWIARLGVGGRA